MKNVIILIQFALLFLFASNLNAKPTFKNKLIKEITILPDSSIKIIEKYPNGSIAIEGYLHSSDSEIKHGKYKFYHKKGYLKAEGEYYMNFPNGIWYYYNKKGDTLNKLDYAKAIDFLAREVTENPDDPSYVLTYMPTFKGKGPEKFVKYIQNKITYPIYAKTKGIEGRAYLKFTVDVEGKIKDIKITRSAGSLDLNMEAIRAVSEAPDWKPGMDKNKNKKKLAWTIPVSFSLR